MRAMRALALSSLLLLTGGCSTLGYYAHVTRGQIELLAARESVASVLADEGTDAVLRSRLRQAQAARRFASDRLGLPRNRSYTFYADIGRPYATWAVFAAPEFSTEPVTHCFPFAGCVAYLGFFDRAHAERAARHLSAQGDDTSIEGVTAYSTLGWFADPILSSMLRWDDDELDGVIFHELAHQLAYAKGDTAFNESFATFVQTEGLRQWRASRGLPLARASLQARDEAFTQLVLDLRARVAELYARDTDVESMRAGKQREITAFRARYARLRDREWQGDTHYDTWVAAPINNARLVPFGVYERWVPAFAWLFHATGSRWSAFHACVGALAKMTPSGRESLLAAFANGADGASPVAQGLLDQRVYSALEMRPSRLPSACMKSLASGG
jgi:predicted aminopeptidase